MSTLYLPAWSIGPDCYKEVYEIVRPYGKKVAVIGGHTALSVAMPKLKAALEGTDLELTDPIWFGGEASYENAAMLEAMDEVKNADVIFGVGGGRAMDTAKCAAGHLNKPIFAFPTLASNCASCTTLCVMYYPDGAMRDLYYPKRCAAKSSPTLPRSMCGPVSATLWPRSSSLSLPPGTIWPHSRFSMHP